MKQLLLLAAITFVITGSSCKKSYNCYCENDIYTENKLTNRTTDIKVITASKQDDAAVSCASNNYDSKDVTGSGTITRCSIK